MNNFETINILKQAEKEAYNLKHPYVGTEHVILSILKFNNKIKSILNENGINYLNYKTQLKTVININKKDSPLIYTPLLKRVLLICSDNFTIENIFLNILKEGEGIGISLLNNLKLDIQNIYETMKHEKDMNNIGIDLTRLAKEKKLDKVIGRDKEINKMIESLNRKNKCNVLLLGEAGVGKTAIVEGLAQKIISDEVPEQLRNYKILSVSMSSLVSGTKYRGEFEEKIEKLIKKISTSKKTIIFIDEIHTLVGAGGAEGAIDASNILKPYLARNAIKCIGSTTISEYNKSIKKDKALDRRFNKIIVNEPNTLELKNIMYEIKKDYEKYHNIRIYNSEIDYIINITKNIKDKHEPDRTIDLLDEVCSKASIYLKEKEVKEIKTKINKMKEYKKLYLSKKDYSKAINYKKNEIELKKQINNIRPKITKQFIDSIISKDKVGAYLGFK